MDDFLAIIAGGILLIGASLAPKKSRDAVKDFFTNFSFRNDTGSASEFGNSLANSGATIPNIDYVDINEIARKSVLTEDDIVQLANHIKSKHGFNLDTKLLVSTAYVESSFRAKAVRHERRKDGTIWDSSYGLMQTLVGTARDMYQKGYKSYGLPDADDLTNPIVSMYFGASYMDWLRKNWPNRSEEWYVRAYNGGPGWERTANGPKNTAHYYRKYVSAYKQFSIDVSFG